VEAVQAYYDGVAFVPLRPVKAKRNQKAIVTILEDETKKESKPFLRFIGLLSNESYDEISNALVDTQKVDANEW